MNLNKFAHWRTLLRPAYFAGLSALSLLIASPLQADSHEAEISEHVAAAEAAFGAQEFRAASAEYRKAAELSNSAKVAERAAGFAFRYEFNDDTRAAAKRWLELDKDNQRALVYLGLAELRDGNLRRARRSFEIVLDLGDEPAAERLVGMVPLLADEDPVMADKLMRQLSKPYKDSADAHYAAAVIALYAGDDEEARKRAQIAVKLKPDWLRPHLLYARALLLAGDDEGAIDYTARLVGDNADPDPEARLELAIMYLSAGRNDDALSQVNQVLLEQPSRTDALRLLAILNFRLGNLDASWQDFEDLLATGQYSMDAYYYLARIADRRDESDRAIALYSRVVQGDNAVISQRRVGGILAEQEKYDEAESHLERFGDEYPQYAVDMIEAQARLYASIERYDDALEYMDRVVAIRPDREETLLGKAELLLRMGRLEDSIAVYRDAAKRWSDSAMSLNALGYTLADRTDQIDEAAKLIKKALKLDPGSAAIIDSYGWVLYRQGDYANALLQLEEAYSNFEDPEVASHIVEVLWKLGRSADAMERLVDAEEQWPENELLEKVRALVAPEDSAE